MAAPYSTKRNDFINNPKKSDIETPLPIAYFIASLIEKSKVRIDEYVAPVIDIGAGNGNLSDPWKRNRVCADIKPPKKKPTCRSYIVGDFFQWEMDLEFLPSLVVCNPPFNWGTEPRQKHLRPYLFLQKIFEVYGKGIPLVLFAPMGLLLNQRLISTRWRDMLDQGYSKRITSIVSLPIDVFENIQIHSLVLMFNIKGLDTHYFLPTDTVEEIQRERS